MSSPGSFSVIPNSVVRFRKPQKGAPTKTTGKEEDVSPKKIATFTAARNAKKGGNVGSRPTVEMACPNWHPYHCILRATRASQELPKPAFSGPFRFHVRGRFSQFDRMWNCQAPIHVSEDRRGTCQECQDELACGQSGCGEGTAGQRSAGFRLGTAPTFPQMCGPVLPLALRLATLGRGFPIFLPFGCNHLSKCEVSFLLVRCQGEISRFLGKQEHPENKYGSAGT